MSPVDRKLLSIFPTYIPFLRHIPDEIYFTLDPKGFYLPGRVVAKVRKELEKQLDHYVMMYKRNVFSLENPAESHLCAHLHGAGLSREQINITEL